GYMEGLQRNILDLELGDAQAFAEGYREKPSLYATIEEPEAMIEQLEAAGFLVAPRLLASGLGAGESSPTGAQPSGGEAGAGPRRAQEHGRQDRSRRGVHDPRRVSRAHGPARGRAPDDPPGPGRRRARRGDRAGGRGRARGGRGLELEAALADAGLDARLGSG